MPHRLLLATCLWTFLLPAFCGAGLVVHACPCEATAFTHGDSCDHDPCGGSVLRPSGVAADAATATVAPFPWGVPGLLQPGDRDASPDPGASPGPQPPSGLPLPESDLPLLI